MIEELERQFVAALIEERLAARHFIRAVPDSDDECEAEKAFTAAYRRTNAIIDIAKHIDKQAGDYWDYLQESLDGAVS